MGHLGHIKQEYRELAHRLDAGTAPFPEPLKALTRLPPAQRALASDQVKSRFVKAVPGRVRDPAVA